MKASFVVPLILKGKGTIPVSRPLLYVRTVGKVNSQIFLFFLKNVVNIAILELEPVPNESPGNFTYYRGTL